MLSAEGRAPARARRGIAWKPRWSRPSIPPAVEPGSGGKAAPLSRLGVLGAVTAAALGVSAAGVDLVEPADASTPLLLSLKDAQSGPVDGAAAVALAPAVLMPALPGRVRLVLSLSDSTLGETFPSGAFSWPLDSAPLPPANPRETPWQEAVAVPERPTAAPTVPFLHRAPADPQSTPAPAPVMKPPALARAVANSPAPPVVWKPQASRASVADVVASFASFGYDLDQVRAAGKPVPRLYLEALPRDLANISSVATKKRLFVQSVLPIVLRVNEEITTARWRAERLSDKLLWEDALSDADRAWLTDMAELYGAAPFDVPSLLKRMDVVPPSLALAQAAEETGWGTSRFVREGNALFGQYTYKAAANGMLPERRDADRRHRVRSHDSLLAAVRAYVHNLNSHWAYDDFRDRRAKLRSAGKPIDGHDLAGELARYSARGEAYVETIRTIMRQNRLRDFDGAWLNNRQWTALIGTSSSEEPI